MIRRLAPAIAVAGLVLAACGSGEGSADDAPTATPAPAEPSPTEPSATEPAATGSDPEPAAPGSTESSTGASTGASTPPTSASGDEGGSAVIPENVPAALQFAAPLIGGGDIELTTLAGRPVLLWFWAPW